MYGKYKLLDEENLKVYAYTRTLGDEKFLVLLNFSKDTVNWFSPEFSKVKKTLLISNYVSVDGFFLQPYGAIFYRVGD